jgi:hypothetical protein
MSYKKMVYINQNTPSFDRMLRAETLNVVAIKLTTPIS